MNNRKDIAIIVSGDNKSSTKFELINSIKSAGFHNVFIQWYKDGHERNQERLEYIRKIGLNIIFAHLDYSEINSIWEDGERGDLLVEEYKADINKSKQNKIPMVIMHLTKSSSPPMFNELGLDRIRKIVNYTKKLDIKIALENTRVKGYLEYVLGNIPDNNLGICYDSGHCHAHFNDEFDFLFFKDRIFAVHLHDNHKIDDEHLIPFDGTIDWDWTMAGLKEGGYLGPITLECVYGGKYLDISPSDFFDKAYKTGQKLLKKF